MLTRRAFGGATLAAAVAPAQESKQARGRRVLDEALAALGGPKFAAMRDRVETGRAYSFYRDRMTGLARAAISTRYVMRPEPPTAEPNVYQRERQSFRDKKDKEEFAYLFDETKGWEITFRGVRPFPAERIERYRDSTRRNIFYILRQRLGEPGLIVESAGSQVFENQPVELVDIVDGDNNTVTVYFHRTTKLPTRQVYFRRDPIARERHEEVTIFGKFRDSGGGVMWPWAITRTRDGDKVFEIFSDSVKINTALDDSRFTMPVNLPLLPEGK